MPVDPVSSGTWIAASDGGFIAMILNRNPDRTSAVSSCSIQRVAAGPCADRGTQVISHGRHGGWPLLTRKSPTGRGVSPHQAHRSRGAIIPTLLSAASIEDALNELQSLDLSAFPPFRLLLADRDEVNECESLGKVPRIIRRHALAEPLMFTSSGLGDDLVEAPRRQLFGEMFENQSGWMAAQDAFHRHVWPERTHLSVCMSRPDARTVSLTTIDFDEAGAVMSYYPDAPNQAVQPISRGLVRAKQISAHS